jgi:hypothetical protein
VWAERFIFKNCRAKAQEAFAENSVKKMKGLAFRFKNPFLVINSFDSTDEADLTRFFLWQSGVFRSRVSRNG